MSKKAVYLDERERDLARRVCDFALSRVDEALSGQAMYDVDWPARRWFKKEVQALHEKFVEPETEAES